VIEKRKRRLSGLLQASCLALLIPSGTAMVQQKFDLSDVNVTRAVNELSGEMLECAVFWAASAISQNLVGQPSRR